MAGLSGECYDVHTIKFDIRVGGSVMPLLRIDVLLLVVIVLLVLIWAQNSNWLARCVRKFRLWKKQLRRRIWQGKRNENFN